MIFNGLWKNRNNNEVLSIYGPLGGDDYWLEYGNHKEKVFIFISNERHALIPESKKFGRNNIFIISPNEFRIDNDTFERQ